MEESIEHLYSVANRCFLCEEDEEIVEHLLIHCKKVGVLWDLFFFMIVGMSWVFLCSLLHTLLAWQGALVGKKTQKKLDGSSSMSILDNMA